jgi:hypothetical protein
MFWDTLAGRRSESGERITVDLLGLQSDSRASGQDADRMFGSR